MKKVNYFSALEMRRYRITSINNNVSQVSTYSSSYNIQAVSSTWELVMNLTYNELCGSLKKHFGINDVGAGDNLQSYRNHLSTLNSFLASTGKTIDSRVGVELKSGFNETLAHYLEITQLATRTKRDRRSHMNLIRRLHDEQTKDDGKTQPKKTSLSLELRAAIAKTGLAPKTLAKQTSVSTSALQRWLSGAMPNKRGIPTLRRLESALSLPRNHFVSLLKEEVKESDVTVKIAYRDRLKALHQDHYIIPESGLSPEFLKEWHDLFMYKTSTYTNLERSTKGRWRCVPMDTAKAMSVHVQRGNTVSPTGEMVLDKIRAFFGVLALPEFQGLTGTRLPAAKNTMTLGWLANPDALNAYIEWVTNRSGGIVHNGQRVFCQTVSALVRPGYGYLWQSPQIAERLPDAVRPVSTEAWHAMCEKSHKLMKTWLREINGLSRDPAEPIAFLLKLANPLAPLFQALEKIDQAAASAPPGSISEALLRRDGLLFSMLLANPLRLRTFMSMSWRNDDSGTVRGDAQTGWRIKLKSYHQKNGAKHKSHDYDVRINHQADSMCRHEALAR